MSFKPHQQANLHPRRHGCYYVAYPEGFRSMLMPHSEAASYAAIFKGTVHRDPDAPPTPVMRLRSWLRRVFG